MNRIQILAAAMTLGLAVGAANAAEAPMTKMQMDKMASCQKMTKDMMMKDAECVKLSKMHDDMAMKNGGAMKKDSMSKDAMTPKSGM